MSGDGKLAMSTRLWCARIGVLAVSFALLVPGRCDGAEIKLATDAPKAIPPEESRKQFQLPEGFRIELAAAEPHVKDPVAIAFDARGRILVCEIHGYNLEGYLDVLELNKTGTLDKAVRRIPANPEAIRQAEQEQYGTVKVLEDTDGDGLVDRSTVLADRLPACYGVVAARDGAIVLAAPDVIYLADRDGDGEAEVRETLFTGFGLYDMWSRINNPRWGLDNWIYAVNGIGSGGTIRGPRLAGEVRIGAVCFRFKPDGSQLEPVSGSTSGFGLTMTDWGDRFLVANQQHALFVAPLPHRYLARNPYYASPSPVLNISSYGHPARVYPTSRPDPWRLARSLDPAWVKFYGVAETTANGFFTAASGQAIYRATQFPTEYRGNHFSVDNAQNMVHRCLLVPDGAGYTARRPREDEQTEFLTSTEQWFRPVNLTVGPEGALYIVDMYRDVIEDYSAIPRYLQQLYIESLVAGADRGRIWRVVAEGPVGSRRLDLAGASAARLVAELSGGNALWRRTAQRLLVERQETAAVESLVALVRDGASPQGRLHALYTLDGLDALTPEVVERALGDPHFGVRLHALRLAERWLGDRPTLLGKVVGMVDDPHPKVRLQLAFTLGESRDSGAVEALALLAARYGADRWVRAAVLSSVGDSAGNVLAAILRRPDESGDARLLVHPLASVVGARHDDDEIGNLLAAVAEVSDDETAALQPACLNGLIEGLKRGKSDVLRSPAGQQGLRRLLIHPSTETRELAFQVAGLVRLKDAPEMNAAYAHAGELALDESRSVLDRQLALSLLTSAPYATLEPLAEDLLAARQPLDLQLAAIAVLSSSDDPRVGSALLVNWPSYTPKVQTAVLEAVFSRQNRLAGLLDAIEQGDVQPSALDAIRRGQLIGNSDPAIQQRARTLLSGQGSKKGRDEVLARYVAALAQPRDPRHGKQVYEAQCSKCHQLQGQGSRVGPDLATASTRTDETIVSDVLDPSNQLTVGYQNYTVVTEDGRIFTGVLGAETATSITLRKEEGVEQTILRKDIDEMEASALSMMPEELEKEVQPQDIADLLGYFREALGPVPPPGVTLFDDEPEFAAVLREGEGTASLHTADRHSGKASLAISPPQRWNLQIPGWEYPIAENPGPGEFRFLRFAWKSQGGQGVMIELAGDGKWPPADKPLWRYYAGKNTTGWEAVQVSDEAPGEWVVVTRDLWSDFGPFTLTGIAPTAIGGKALFDRIELLRAPDDVTGGQ